jgi:hypothetical protein
MISFKQSDWAEPKLHSLVGMPEGLQLEFKCGLDFDSNQRNKVVDDLTKEMSAFANSEGGTIVIGMKEDKKSRPPTAAELDGVNPTVIPLNQLEDLLESNLRPYLPGVRYLSVRLSDKMEGRCAYIIQVPKGSTAYQASDYKYYSRLEFKAKAMPDHEVRLRMMRGRVAQVAVETLDWRKDPMAAGMQREEKQEAHRRAFNEAAKSVEYIQDQEEREAELVARLLQAGTFPPSPKNVYYDKVWFRLGVRNCGEVTIHDFALSITSQFASGFWAGPVSQYNKKLEDDPEYRFRLRGETQTMVPDGFREPLEKIFPGDCLQFPPFAWLIEIPEGRSMRDGNLTLLWKVFLDDAPPCEGSLDLFQEYERHASERNAQAGDEATSTAPDSSSGKTKLNEDN